MTRFFNVFLVVFLSIAILGCEDGAVAPNSDTSSDPSSEAQVRTETMLDPASVLSGLSEASIPVQARNAHGPSSEFATPLFGLATAPNGDVLVADAGAGIATRSGATDISLPGVTDMSPLGRRSMWALEGLTGAPGDDTGQGLYRATKGKNRLIADLFAFEKINNPDGAELIDSNPFDVQSLGGQAALVADAGGNDLLRVDNQGNIEVLAVLPDEPVPTANAKELLGCPEGPPFVCGNDMILAQPVATSVAIGPNGYYYVGELKGFPAPTGESNVWKIAPDASWAECGKSPDCEKLFDGGFTSIIDLRFDEDGTLHVVELDERSWLAVEREFSDFSEGGSINACDLDASSATACTEIATGIPILTGITFGKDGTLWATKNALLPDKATVVKIH